MSESGDSRKIGEDTLAAWMRLGLAELRQAASFGGNVEQPTPYGMYGNPTPGQVAGQTDYRQPMEASAMTDARPDLPSPSQVIDNPQAYQAEPGRTPDHAMERGNADALPSPSQVIDNPAAYQPEQTPGQERHHEHGRGM